MVVPHAQFAVLAAVPFVFAQGTAMQMEKPVEITLESVLNVKRSPALTDTPAGPFVPQYFLSA